MKRFLKVVYLIFWVCATSQLAIAQNEADSLLQKAFNTSNAGEKSDLFLSASKILRRTNLDSCEKYLNIAIRYANISEDGDKITRCQMSKGALKWMQGHLEEAQINYETALNYWTKKNNKTEMARCMLNLGNVLQASRDNEKAIYYLRGSLKYADEVDEKLISAQSAGTAATVFFQLGEADSVFTYSEIAFNKFQNLGDSANMARSQSNLGMFFREMGRSQESRKYYQKALSLIENSKEKSLIGEINEGISTLEHRTGNFDAALKYGLISYEMFRELGWMKRIAGNNLLLASALQTLGREEAAMGYVEESRHIADSMGLYDISAAALTFIADKYKRELKYQRAITTYRKALELEAMGPKRDLQFSKYMGISQCFQQINMPDSANLYLEKAFDIARKSGKELNIASGFMELAAISMRNQKYNAAIAQIDSAQYWYSINLHPNGLFEAWSLRSQCLESMGDFMGALQAQRTASSWQDSIFSTHSTEQLLSMEAKYWGEKKEHSLEMARQNAVMQEVEADRAREASEKFAAQRNLLISALGLLILFGSALYYVNLKRRENLMKNRLTEMRMIALRAQMNPHFIFNALGSVQLLINTQNVREANQFLTKFARLLRMILENSSKKEISLEDELESLRLYVELEALRFKFKHSIEVAADIDPSDTTIPGMILQPIVENAVKHGLSGQNEEGKLEIIFKKEGNSLVCTIRDNGMGRENARKINRNEKGHTSMGTDIIQERLAHLQPHRKDRLVITDLKDQFGHPTGTQVDVFIPLPKNA